MENIKYLEMIMTGTKLLTINEFYVYYDELKSSSEDKLPLFLYSFNLIDKFKFSKLKDSNTTILINNNEFISNKPYIHCLFKKEAFGMEVNEIEQLFETYLVDRIEP